jgi:Uma2 family endonuclease
MVQDAVAPWAEPVLYTADDLAAMPEDAWQYELVRGRLVRRPPAGWEHGNVELKVARILAAFVEEHKLGTVVVGEAGFLLSQPNEDETVLGADVAFVAAGRTPAASSHESTAYPRLAPDLVIEIASPSQSRNDLAAKVCIWLDAGVRLVWVVWPADRGIDVWQPGVEQPQRSLSVNDALTGGDVVPGFLYPIAALFQS